MWLFILWLNKDYIYLFIYNLAVAIHLYLEYILSKLKVYCTCHFAPSGFTDHFASCGFTDHKVMPRLEL